MLHAYPKQPGTAHACPGCMLYTTTLTFYHTFYITILTYYPYILPYILHYYPNILPYILHFYITANLTQMSTVQFYHTFWVYVVHYTLHFTIHLLPLTLLQCPQFIFNRWGLPPARILTSVHSGIRCDNQK